MELKLDKKPKGPVIIVGFPGFGLVGTITTGFLVEHLAMEQIGTISFREMVPMVAIHQGNVVQPLGLFYNKKYNLLLLHVVTNSTGFEWQLADAIVTLAKDLKAKEILSLEGVGTTGPQMLPGESGEINTYYYTNSNSAKKKLDKITKPLKEGIVLGVTSALLISPDNIPLCALFAETHSALPDSKAAAKIISVLDQYLGLKVDYKPLLKQAEMTEEKLKLILSQSSKVKKEQDLKRLSYLG